MKYKIPYINLSAQWNEEKAILLPIIEKVMESGQFVGGKKVEEFEQEITNYSNSKYCVSLNSGTDALVCSLMALGIKRGDEVITPPNSFIASTSSIVHIGAIPVFSDVLVDQNIDPLEIEKKITNKTKAIMPVHLTGRLAPMDKIMDLAKKHNLKVIEDCAQSIGSKLNNQYSGTWGDIGCFSTHPLKNLNACGDGGFIITNDKDIAVKVKSMRNHGLLDRNKVEKFGYVSRMDTIQASILKYRIKILDEVIKKRRENANLYFKKINDLPIILPIEKENEFNTYHTFVIQTEKRDKLFEYLKSKSIETAIHYPIPIHLQPASYYLGYKEGDFPITETQSKKILTLPIHQFLKQSEINYICDHLRVFFER